MPRSPDSSRRQLRIAIMLHEDSFFIRSVLRGIAAYARPARPWLIERIPPEGFGLSGSIRLDCDGLITHMHHPAMRAALQAIDCPVVSVSHIAADDPLPRVSVDNRAIGRLAAEHLLEHGHRHFAFVGLSGVQFAAARAAGFTERLAESAHTRSERSIPPRWLKRSPRTRTRNLRLFTRWLSALPRPTGLFAANDAVAWFIGEVCRQADIAIPLHIALLGVDNDDLLCQMAYPPLSSIIVPGRRLGYLAAEQLDHAITRRQPIQPVALAPLGVQTRQSSEFYAMEDQDVVAALRFIRDHATAGITVADVLDEVPLARRALERRFRKLIGRTPLEELHRIRVEAACQMLTTTDLSIEETARRCGFGRANYMSRLLQRYRAQTPRQVRQAASIGS